MRHYKIPRDSMNVRILDVRNCFSFKQLSVNAHSGFTFRLVEELFVWHSIIYSVRVFDCAYVRRHVRVN